MRFAEFTDKDGSPIFISLDNIALTCETSREKCYLIFQGETIEIMGTYEENKKVIEFYEGLENER